MHGVSAMEEQLRHAYEEWRTAVKAERDLNDAIKEREDKAPTAEDKEQFERIEADIELWEGETQRLLKTAKRSKEVDEIRSQFASLFTQDDKQERVVVSDDNESLREMTRRYQTDKVLTGFDSVYSPRVIEAMVTPGGWTRALTTPGATAFGTTFIDQVLLYEVDESPMLNPANVTVIVTPRGEAQDWPRLTADASVAGTLTAEAAALTEADATLSKVTLNAYKYGGIQIWSDELDEDNVINLRSLLARSAARHIVEQVNAPLTTGDGSSKPNGIVTAATNAGTATPATGGTVTPTFVGGDDLLDLVYSLKSAYRNRGKFMAASSGLKHARKLADLNGQYIWAPGAAPGQPSTLLGYPVIENPDMAAVASASKSFLFGDFSLYHVRRVNGARVALSTEYKFNTDQIALKVTERLDGDLLDANGVAYIVSANT